MAKKDVIKLTGVIIKCLPGAKFIVRCEDYNIETICSLAGKLRQRNIRICENDKVDYEVSPHDLTNGRIIWRH